jgi:hypothetical protein
LKCSRFRLPPSSRADPISPLSRFSSEVLLEEFGCRPNISQLHVWGTFGFKRSEIGLSCNVPGLPDIWMYSCSTWRLSPPCQPFIRHRSAHLEN